MSDDKNLNAQERIKQHRRFNILSLDGGGVRGTVEAVITSRIVDENPNFLRDTDLIAGTSTGGIQALGLASGRTPHQIEEMYTDLMKYVFADCFLDDFRDLWRIAGADYNNKNLKNILRDQFGNMKLGELDKKVAIPAFDLDNGSENKRRGWKLKVFHNFPGEDSDAEESVVDVALRTSAAPVFFPTYQGYADGGLVANNPSMVALSQALDDRTGAANLDQIRLLSLGAGFSGRWIKGNNHDWGAAQWAPHILFIALEGAVHATHFQCKQLLGWKDKYFRINPILSDKMPLDDWKKVPELVKIGQAEDLTEVNKWLGDEWK